MLPGGNARQGERSDGSQAPPPPPGAGEGFGGRGSLSLAALLSRHADGPQEALDLERALVGAMLNHLFKGSVSKALMTSLYPPAVRSPQFVDCRDSGWPQVLEAHRKRTRRRTDPTPSPQPPAQAPPDDSVWCRLVVQGFVGRHFERDVFPAFSVSVVKLDGSPLPRLVEEGHRKPMVDMRIQISVWNKWANVSQEVLKDVELVRTLKDGRVVVDDLMFQEISLKHGGFFTLVIEPIDYHTEVLPWRSPKILIQSVKTHSNKKRKTKSSSSASMSPAPAGVSHSSSLGSSESPSGSSPKRRRRTPARASTPPPPPLPPPSPPRA